LRCPVLWGSTNLFYPLIAEKQLNLFYSFLGIDYNPDLQAEFEKESELEAAARRTSFDFYVADSKMKEIFVEVKYTEEGFGRAKSDEAHKAKFQKTYLPLIKKSSFLSSQCNNEKVFLANYQILRNLVHISDTAHVVLLFPSANSKVSEAAKFAKNNLLNNAGRDRLNIVHLDELVSYFESQSLKASVKNYFQNFRAKYCF
jgi:hypothetical protein